MSVDSITRHHEHDRDDRRRVRRAISVSIGFHTAVVVVLVIAPPIAFRPPPRSITVELIEVAESIIPTTPRPGIGARVRTAAPSRSRPAPRRKLAPPPPAPAPVAEQLIPVPPPEPPAARVPPIQKVPAQVLPEKETKPETNVEREPEALKPQQVIETELPPSSSTAFVQQPAHPLGGSAPIQDSAESDGDSLEGQLGNGGAGDSPAAASPPPAERRIAEPPGRGEARAGASINAEDAAWGRAVRPRIRNKWRALSKYHGREIVMVMSVEVSSAGELIGEPQILRTSGDRRFDRDVVRGALAASPLPPPPHPGKLIVIFASED